MHELYTFSDNKVGYSVDLIINRNTKEAFLTISGYIILSGLPSVNDSKFELSRQTEISARKVVTESGRVRYIPLITEKEICNWLKKDNPKLLTSITQPHLSQKASCREHLHFLSTTKAKRIKEGSAKIYPLNQEDRITYGLYTLSNEENSNYIDLIVDYRSDEIFLTTSGYLLITDTGPGKVKNLPSKTVFDKDTGEHHLRLLTPKEVWHWLNINNASLLVNSSIGEALNEDSLDEYLYFLYREKAKLIKEELPAPFSGKGIGHESIILADYTERRVYFWTDPKQNFIVNEQPTRSLNHFGNDDEMPELTHKTFVSEDGIEVIINTTTGESFCSIKGYARLSGVSKQAISKRISKLERVNPGSPKIAEVQTAKGKQRVNLIPESLIAEWITKDNPAIATKMLQAGIKLFLYGIAGYKIVEEPDKISDAIEILDRENHRFKTENQRLRVRSAALEEKLELLSMGFQSSEKVGKVCVKSIKNLEEINKLPVRLSSQGYLDEAIAEVSNRFSNLKEVEWIVPVL